jgi:hypothetical protein
VAVTIDPVGNAQTAYLFFVNPSGIQGDALNTSISTVDDTSPDYVWHSAGKITDSGYQVEICLPLKSIPFKSGEEVKMGLLFVRKISRLGFSGSWPDIKLSQSILESQTKMVLKNLKKQLKLEILPSLTHSNNRDRISQSQWSDSDTDTQFGFSLKYGLGSSTTAEMTINPDFSQVESDAFQVEVNRRYPLFYREKRPFFMEGADIFKFFTLSFGFFQIPVHTRQIIDPAWGVKLTGEVGKMSFGVLAAGDEWPGQPWESELNPNEGKQAYFGVVRGKYSLGKNYVGFIYSGREFAGEYNRVMGLDFRYRLGTHQRINASFLHSISKDEAGIESKAANSNNFNFNYVLDKKHVLMAAAFEHIGKEFRMDSAYMTRWGIDHGYFQFGYAFYPDAKKTPWLKLFSPQIEFEYIHDIFTDLNDIRVTGHLLAYTTKEGYLRMAYRYFKENWQGQAFHLNRFFIIGSVLLNKWLRIGGQYSYGESIYYWGNPVVKGAGNYITFDMNIQPNQKINQYFSLVHSDLSNSGQELFDVNILYSRTTYQFNKYFFLRSVIQYDSSQKLMLTDFLASFTLIPGTVLHVGYGGLYESRKWENDQWLYGQGDLLNIKRSFFAKISYLWRF